jgi:hypothetical protein
MKVAAGLYMLKYASAPSQSLLPLIFASPSTQSARSISVLPIPGAPDFLQCPGDWLLVRAQKPGSLDLIVRESDSGGSLEAEVRLERVVSADAKPQIEAAGRAAKREVRSRASETPMVEMMAHIAHIGDITVAAGEWICGPDLPLPIEGVQLDWANMPSDVSLGYAVSIARRARQRLEHKRAGQYAGTRGKALPIIGLQLVLNGAGAARFELQCDALFLGAHVTSRKGQTLSLAGPTGREPLIGIRVTIISASAPRTAGKKIAVQSGAVTKDRGRVRVYRSTSSSSS